MTAQTRRQENVISKTAQILVFSAILAMPRAKLSNATPRRTVNQTASIVELHSKQNGSPINRGGKA